MSSQKMHTELTEEECWEFLQERTLARLAYVIADEVDIVPINYVVDGRSLLFRSSEGNKMFAVHVNRQMALEVDDVSEMEATSVVVRVTSEEVPWSEKDHAEELGLKPWVPTEKFNVIRLNPLSITGRRYGLTPHAEK